MPLKQLSLIYGKHNNQQLFSDHYLDVILPQRAEWPTLVDSARPIMETIAGIFTNYKPSDNEAQLEHELARPILSALGHHFEVQPSLKTPNGTKKPDYVFYTDAVARDANKGIVLSDALPNQGGIAIGDAKYWDRPLDVTIKSKAGDIFNNKNPGYQIAFYVQHSGLEWGILTNGRLWRLYHRDTAHKLDRYYEVDLPYLLETGDPEAFLYFTLFFQRTAFDAQPLGLREILKESQDYARAVGDSLKLQVYDALWHLSQGFLDYPGNKLTADPATLTRVYDNSLILLYRFLFILYAEARELLPVRESAMYRNRYGLHAVKVKVADDLTAGQEMLTTSAVMWPPMKELFGYIDKGSPPLKIATFNGGLFDPERHPFLNEYAVGDSHLQQAIDGLSRVAGHFIDYRDLSVRHLGAIYEGLLEYRLQPMGQPTDGWTVELVNDKGERKATGSYYTPDYIVKYIVEQAVGPMLNQAISGKSDDAAKIEAILNVNVLDPAMGSGHFLVEATEYMARFVVDLAIPSDTGQAGESDLLHWKRRVAQSCIYGVDLNPLAVELAKLSLWLTTVAKDRPLSFLDHHLRTGNALVGARLEQLHLGGKKPKSKKNGHAANGEANGQLSMMADSAFVQSMSLAVGNMWLIEEMDARTVDDVKNQEKIYRDLRQTFMLKHGRLADLITATHFGLIVPPDLWQPLADYATNALAGLPIFEKLMAEAENLASEMHFFHWELEFPEVFFDRFGRSLGGDAGFDAVVGNPPYIRQEKLTAFKPFFSDVFATYHSVADIYLYFYEQGVKLLQDRGRMAYISSGTFARANFAGAFRKWLPSVARIDTLIDFGENQPFAEAEMVRPTIMALRKDLQDKPFCTLLIGGKIPVSLETALIEDGMDCKTDTLLSSEWVFQSCGSALPLSQLLKYGMPLRDYVKGQFFRGVTTGLNDAFIITSAQRRSLIDIHPSSRSIIKQMLQGEDLRPWYQEDEQRWLIFTRRGVDIDAYPAIKQHLLQYKAQLMPRPNDWPLGKKWIGRKPGQYQWYEIQDSVEYHSSFESAKISWPDICKLPRFSWGEPGMYIGNTGYVIPNAEPYLLGVLQSRTFWYAVSQICQPLRLRAGLWQYRVLPQFISRLPIPDASDADRQIIGNIAMKITEHARNRYALHQKGRQRLVTDFGIPGIKLNNKLTSWWNLDINSLRTELQRIFKKDIPVKEREQWEEWLRDNKIAHQELTSQIIDLETELNDRVYTLFNLNAAERKLIEESTKYKYGEV